MKRIFKSDAPAELTAYLSKNLTGTWEEFKNEDQIGYKTVCTLIKKDQLGICCYCETDFNISEMSSIKDFRIEHFYPKSETYLPNTQENAHLTWSNLFGCCHGGSMNYIDDNRYTNPNLHCDAIKADNIWVEEILNPLHIPEDEKIFTFNMDGEILVAEKCPQSLKVLAQQSITKLNLNEESYLMRARKAVREEIATQFDNLIQSGQATEDALDFLKEALFGEAATNMKFYTCKLDYVSY